MMTFIISLLIHSVIVGVALRGLFLVEGLTQVAIIAVGGILTLIVAAVKGRRSPNNETSAYLAGATTASLVGSATVLWLLWALSHPIGTPPSLREYLGTVTHDSGGMAIVTLPIVIVLAAYLGSKLTVQSPTGTSSA